MRYKLYELYISATSFKNDVKTKIDTSITFGKTTTELDEIITFACNVIYGYFYDDLVVYSSANEGAVADVFIKRLGYDLSIKLPYWYKKYNYVKKLLTTEDLSLLQTSKMTSSSNDTTKSAGGTLQKTATTPTGVTATTTPDEINIDIKSGTSDGDNDIETNGFADKYTNAQQKFANATRVEGERSGEILREGSIDDLLKVLEKLPSSFADEISIALQKHFIFDYDGEMLGIYDN